MTKRDLSNLLFKAFAIYSFLAALQNLQYLPGFIYETKKTGGLYFLAIGSPTVAMTLAGVLLWFLSDRGSGYIFGKEESGNIEPASIKDIQALARSLVGLYLVATAGPELITDVVLFVWLFLQGSELKNVLTTVLYPAVRLIIGFWLLLGTKGMVVFIRKMWEAGRADRYGQTEKE